MITAKRSIIPLKLCHMINKIYFGIIILFFASCGNSSTDNDKTEPNKKDTVTVKEIVDDTVKTKMVLTDTILLLRMGENNLYGYQDTSGNWLIKPQFLIVGEFSDGLAPVLANDSLQYVIDKKGKKIFKSPYDFIVLHHELSGEITLNGFRDGMIPVINENQKIGFMDDKFKLKIPYRYDEIAYFSEGVAPVAIHDDANLENDWGLIDKNGRWIVKTSMNEIWGCSNNRCLFERNELIGYMDRKGKIIIKEIYTDGFRFNEGLTFVTHSDFNNYFCIIDTMGKIINKGPYELVYGLGFENGECEVIRDGKCIFIDKTGKKIRDSKNGCHNGC